MTNKTNKHQHGYTKFDLRRIKSRDEVHDCPMRNSCVELWGGEEQFCTIRDLPRIEWRYKQGEFVYKKNKPVTSLYIIQSGAIKLEKKVSDDVNHVSGFCFSGDIVGMESIGYEQYRYNAIALNDTCVCEIRINKLSSLGESAAAIHQRISTLLGRKVCEIDEHLYNTRNLDAEQRLLSFLKILCTNKLNRIDSNLNLFEVPIMKIDVASYLGMRPESLSRALAKLVSRGIIKNHTNRNKMIIDKKILLGEKKKHMI